MSEVVMTLAVPEQAVRRATRLATLTQQRVEDVLTRWLDWAAAEIPVETLPNDELLALCDLEMDEDQQQELARLLAKNREGFLDTVGQARLDELMQVYRHGLVRKAQALQVAVRRGLRPPLGLTAL
jgi:dsDNA-binding SOS-regulon protein